MSTTMFRLIFITTAFIAAYSSAILFEIDVQKIMVFMTFIVVADYKAKDVILSILMSSIKNTSKKDSGEYDDRETK